MSLTGKNHRRFQIDLDRSRAPRAYRDAQNLWRDDIQRIHRLIARQVENLAEWERQQERAQLSERKRRQDDRPHLSIAIFGPSGSGKSSLIRTLADDIRREHSQILQQELEKKVSTLPVMDPTTWAPTDQFLYAFLASALEEERYEQMRKEHGYPQGLSPVQLSFQEVNEYLRVVDEPERSEEHDPLGLSLQKLERHTSGLRLRQALGQLIEELAKEFRSEVILLPVDDLDMAPDHLVDSLQSYQSFLTHPRLVPVFTFTDRMPEELIEVYYNNSMKGAASHERLGGINRLSISEQMAVQFLARCFPVRNRIRLGPAPARVQRALYSSQATSDANGKPEKSYVSELLIQSSFLLFGHPDGEDSHQIRAALRPSTLRRQFQVVDAMSDCRLWTLRTPQLAKMAQLSSEEIAQLSSSSSLDLKIRDNEASWKEWPTEEVSMSVFWPKFNRYILDPEKFDDSLKSKILQSLNGYKILAFRMRSLKTGATWATVFSNAAWSLLNVHRDTLRELGLFLEDLYSWTPRELRSVVLENILAQDQITRRTVVDRWFNRTDYRRSQVLSLLAANIFRPWLDGEEPFGDEEVPLRKQLEIEKKVLTERITDSLIDSQWNDKSDKQTAQQIRKRLTIPAPSGLLWFLNVTLGFYLPQIMARNWGKVLPHDAPVKSRMSGNGWDLHHAATNAVRIADDKQEIFSFGMLFLDPTAYRRALEVPEKAWPESSDTTFQTFREQIETKETDAQTREEMWRRHLLLRIWSCCGYSNGRYWSAFSLWRGLGFIGQVLELGFRHEETIQACSRNWFSHTRGEMNLKDFKEAVQNKVLNDRRLKTDLLRLIRTHGLQGLVPGFLLSEDTNDVRLLHGFLKWDPRQQAISSQIEKLAFDLVSWLAANWNDSILPLAGGDIWLGWKDCFLRRVHGEYILGGLWPRLNSAYLEGHRRMKDWDLLGVYRSLLVQDPKERWNSPSTQEKSEAEKYRWAASLAAGAWSDLLLEYWRGCQPILKLLLTCPVMFQSNERFGCFEPEEELGRKVIKKSIEAQKDIAKKCFQRLSGSIENSEHKERLKDPVYAERFHWLNRLGLESDIWSEILRFRETELGDLEWTLVPSELAIPRVQAEQFSAPPKSHHFVHLERATLAVADLEPSDDSEGMKEEYSDDSEGMEGEYIEKPDQRAHLKPGHKDIDPA